MTRRARKHAVMTDIEIFEKRDRRTHRSIGTSPYHTSRRAKDRRDGRADGWVYTWDDHWWLNRNWKTFGYVAKRLCGDGFNGTRYDIADDRINFVTKKCETLMDAKRFVEGKDEE